jgi:hypothetical protein
MLWSDSNGTEDSISSSYSNELISFDADGFTSGGDYHTGHSSGNYVAWNWKANGAGVTNTDGSITSNVSANPAAGFSIVSDFTEGGTVGHGLNGKPDMMIMKSRTVADDWFIYHSSVPTTPFYQFGSTGVNSGKYVNFFNSTQPDSNVFTMNSGDGQTGGNLLAYCFRSIEGYSKFGIYTGNGSANGTFVHTGFRSAYVMIKRTDTTGSWCIVDNMRGQNGEFPGGNFRLRPNTSGAEDDQGRLDIVSNGFKLLVSYPETNANGGTYIFMAFAETPFKHSNAR